MKICQLSDTDLPRITKFLAGQPRAAIQQNPTWAELQAILGSQVIWLGLENEAADLIAFTQILQKKLPLGLSWLHIPRGPVLSRQQDFDLFLPEIQKIAKQNQALFLRFDWPADLQITNSRLLPSHSTNFPETTLILDLTQTEEELLSQMKSKGRYNIRLADKHGIEVKEVKDLAAAEIFADLLAKTTARDGFAGHGRDYYRQFLQLLGEQDLASCFIARYRGQPVAASLVTWAGDTATYYYGASDHEFRNLMAPYLLQWRAIQAARERGFKKYDFLGIAPENSKNHALAGVTSFKKKFGGQVIDYPASAELILRPLLFNLFKIYKKIRGRA